MSGKRRAAAHPGTTSQQRTRGPADARGTGRGKVRGKPRRRGHLLRRILLWLTLAGLLGVVVLAGAAVVVYRSVDLPPANAGFQSETTFVYYDDGKEELGRFATQNRERVTLEEMSESVKDAVVAIENPTFWTDSGVDPKGILRAAFNNAQGGDTQGGSTITQQYIKVLYLNQERSYTRKVKEAVLALKLQKQLSKEAILEGYLNAIYFGNGSYGVQAAAQTYFGVDAADLDLAQSAVLAAVLNSPSRFDPYEKDSKKLLRSRYKLVLAKMVEHGDVTADEVAPIGRKLPKFAPLVADSTYGGQKGHMLELVKAELLDLGYLPTEIEGGGLKVTTTLDQATMANAAAGVAEVRPDISDDELHVAVASVEPGTGALKGFYGGQDYLTSQINWAVTGGQPGSTFKAFAVAAALEAGFSLEDTFDGNSPYYYDPDDEGDDDAARARNEGEGSDGLGTDYGSSVNLLTGTEDSINTVFADLTMQIPDGPEAIMDMSEDLGIPAWDRSLTGLDHLETSPGLQAVPSIALGSATVAPINMANAYATIADGGRRSEVHVVEKVVSPDGKHDYDRSTIAGAQPTRVLSPEIAADTSYALQEVVEGGTGANAQAIDRPAAGKTGTATNDKDQVSSSWFVGFTPQLATAVMYVRGDGNDQLDDDWLPDYEGATGYFGSNYPTRTWAAVMAADLEGTEVEDLAEPEFVDGDAPNGADDQPTTAPRPTQQPTRQPSQQPSAKPTKKPSKDPTTEAPAPPPPTTSAPAGCQVFDCSTPAPTAEPAPTPAPTPVPEPTPAPPTVTAPAQSVAGSSPRRVTPQS